MKTIYLDNATFLWERKFEQSNLSSLKEDKLDQRRTNVAKGKLKSIRLNKFRGKKW